MWPACLTGVASLSVWLEDATTDAELDDGIRHRLALYQADILDDETVKGEIDRVIAAVVRNWALFNWRSLLVNISAVVGAQWGFAAQLT